MVHTPPILSQDVHMLFVSSISPRQQTPFVVASAVAGGLFFLANGGGEDDDQYDRTRASKLPAMPSVAARATPKPLPQVPRRTSPEGKELETLLTTDEFPSAWRVAVSDLGERVASVSSAGATIPYLAAAHRRALRQAARARASAARLLTFEFRGPHA